MFEGFSPETFDFLWGIRMNNNRDWFMEHKAQGEPLDLHPPGGGMVGGKPLPVL